MIDSIPDSIVNDTAREVKDSVQPFSFLEFIKITNTDYSPEEYNNFYLTYLKTWSEVKNATSSTEAVSYVDYYVTFLKELVVVYSTQQELRFLSTIDYTNPLDLDVAIPFFTEKIRQIILFYKSKRDDVKYVIDRNKTKGTAASIERGLFETIYDVAFNTESGLYTTGIPPLSTIVSNLKIDIQEFVDVYGDYFDIPSQPTSSETQQRREYYTSNINSVETSLFFDDSALNSIFKSRVFLTEIPIAVNFRLSVDPVCDPTNPLLLQNTSQATSCGFTESQLDTLRKNLISKYIGSDLYYVSTINNTVSGILIEAQAPYNNIRNLHQPNTASVQSTEQTLLRNVGLFFKPDKIGLFKLDTNNYTYSIDSTSLEPNKIYIFPDPNKFGNVLANNVADYPVSFVYDYTKDTRNMSSGLAFGDPKVSNIEQSFSPYYTVEQSKLNEQKVDDDFLLNFNDLYNEGYIQKLQYDIFGNEYALFKDAFGQTFKSIDDIDAGIVLSLQLNGHTFYDREEGYGFDYSIASVEGDTIRSGLTALTVDDPSSLSFTLTGFPYTLFFRNFYPYQELASGVTNINVSLKDGGNFTFIDGSLLPDTISADLSSYPGTSIYFYDTLADGGVSSLMPPTRGYYVGSTYNANFTLDTKFVLSSSIVDDYDCGYFTDDLTNITSNVNSEQYYDDVSDSSLTITSNISGNNIMRTEAYRRSLAGNIFVKNQRYSSSQTLTAALTNIFNKYSVNVQQDIVNSTQDFDIFYDSICLETSNYLIFDKIKYDGEFLTPNTKNTVFTRILDGISRFSNRFFDEATKTVTFCTLNQITEDIVQAILTENNDILTTEESIELEAAFTALSGNSKIILPTVYQYDIKTNTVKTIYPQIVNPVEYFDTFSLDQQFTNTFNVNIVHVDSPIVAYNSFNDVYKLTFTCQDNNNLCYIYDYEFTIESTGAVFRNSKFYKSDRVINTADFFNTGDTGIEIQSLKGTYNLNTSDGILTL